MESSKVQVNSNAASSPPPGAAALFDPIALQTAYLAAQLQGQLQQQQQQNASLTTPSPSAAAAALSKYSSASSSGMPLLDIDRFASLLPPQLQNLLQQEQQRNFFLQQNLTAPLTPHYSAFQPTLPGAPELGGVAANAGPSTAPSPSTTSLDLMLMQMQMATAAAAGLLPAPFNLLPPTAALSLLAPQFRIPQLASQMPSPLSYMNLGFDANTLNAMMVKNELSTNVAGVQQQQQQLSQDPLTVTASLSSDSSVEPAVHNLPSNLVATNPAATSGVPFISQREASTSKQRRGHSKRGQDEMTLLRALCNESNSEDGNTPKKRLKYSGGTQENIDEKWIRQQDKQALDSKSREKLISEQSELTQRNIVKDPQSSTSEMQATSFDEKSPNRHHPINHRPPAMEARFLECMTALALHSDLPLLTETENELEIKKEIPTVDVVDKTKTEVMSPISDQENQQTASDEAVTVHNSESHGNTNESVTDTRESLVSTRKEERRLWPETAIDDELCKKLEDYKGANVPVIHAYVIPEKSSASSPSESEERCDIIQSTPSVAVPMPVFKILLDRVLQTMLEPS